MNFQKNEVDAGIPAPSNGAPENLDWAIHSLYAWGAKGTPLNVGLNPSTSKDGSANGLVWSYGHQA